MAISEEESIYIDSSTEMLKVYRIWNVRIFIKSKLE